MKGLILHCFLSLSDSPSHPRLWEGCFLHCLLQPPFPTFFFLNKGSVSFFINCLWRPARNQCLRPKKEKLISYSFSLYVQKEKRLKDVGKFSLENSKPGIISRSHPWNKAVKAQVWRDRKELSLMWTISGFLLHATLSSTLKFPCMLSADSGWLPGACCFCLFAQTQFAVFWLYHIYRTSTRSSHFLCLHDHFVQKTGPPNNGISCLPSFVLLTNHCQFPVEPFQLHAVHQAFLC